MNRGSSYRDKPQHQTAFQAKSKRSSLGPSQRGHRVQEPSSGIAAKDTGKPKHLLKKSSKDPYVLSLIRTKVPKEKTNGQKTLPNIRAPGKGNPPPKDLNKVTKRSNQSVSFAATPKVEVRGKTPTDETRAKKNAEQKEKAPQMSNNTEEKLRAKITSAIINYIESTPFKRQLSEHIVWEISIKIAKAVSQYHEQQLAKRVCKAGAQSKNPARRCQREQSGKLGFSISVASLLGYELIESRDKMIEYFKSKSPELSTSSNAETEIVKNVFENILAFVINLETLHPLEDISTYSPDCMIDSFESILQNVNSADSESPFREPTLSDDESITSLTVSTPADKSDVEPLPAKKFVPSKVDALKVEELDQQEHQENQERISGPRKLMEKIKNFLTPGASDQDQSSEADAEEEDEKIQAAVIPATQTTDIELKNLVTDSGLDQATTSEENILSDVEKQDQELASRVPSPAASEKPDSPGESPKRTTCPPEQTRYSPYLPVSMPETSDTKTIAFNPKEEDEHSLPRSDTENTVSLKSEGKEEEIEMPDPDQEAEEQLVDEPDVLDQVLATPSKVSRKATEKDLQLTRHEKCASPVPSFPYLEEPVSPRKSPLRSTRLTKRSRSVFSPKKVMKKGSVSTPNKLKESRIFSKNLDTKKSKAAPSRKKPQQAMSGDSLKAAKSEPVDSDSETSRTKPDVPEEKPSECNKEQKFFWRSSHKKILLHANKKRMDFTKCCTCDHQEQDQ